MLENAIVRIFDGYEAAQQARQALLAQGFDADAVQLRIANDEAGPVEGNFTVGNTPTESPHHRYDNNYAQVRQASQCVMTVAAPDAASGKAAADILGAFGARAMDAPHP